MPSFVIKVDPSRDEYVYWSTIVDAPTFAGSRTELLEELQMESDPWLREDAPHHPLQRLARADEHGTSCLFGDPLAYGWHDDDPMMFRGEGTFLRDDLWALAMRLRRDEPVDDLLTPFEDDEERA